MPSGSTSNLTPTDVSASVGVRVLLFSVLREQVGASEVAVTLPAPATGNTVLDRLATQYPALRGYRTVVRLAVNEQYAPLETTLHDGDEVALITPVSGG